ncbi:MAG: diadenosine tetraphosphate hydrolase [Parcubacteria group bacterium]|nr:diadenosine tetraphosphate hydrolase [Parcubacteria group bacterium]|tara:strand:- start:1938 stop:2396 length:459 start_codon:yes stop_codon:yes gene_type:complete
MGNQTDIIGTAVAAAGIVPYIRENGVFEFLLIKGGFGWEFPKGHMEEGETRQEAAKRETEEETGLIIEKVYPTFGFTSKYMVTIDYGTRKKLRHPFPKTVTYFLGETSSRDVKLSFEHSEYGWFTAREATKKLSNKKKEVLENLICVLKYDR